MNRCNCTGILLKRILFIPKSLPAKSLVNAVRFMAMGEQYAPIDFMTAVEEEKNVPDKKEDLQ